MPCRRVLGPALLVVVLLASLTWPVQAQPTDLFFSEYIEGSSNNKAVEIFNGTATAIDLGTGGYVIDMYFNGSLSVGTTVTLSGTVAPGDVFVLAHSSANATILAQADQTSGASWYNGDDAVVLRKGAVVLDVLGQIGNDPGTQWGTDLASTADNTIRRKPSICQGDTAGSDAFTPATEWDGFAQDDSANLGTHSVTCGTVTPALSIDNVTLAEGDAGTVSFTFTVSLSAPAGPGGVTFDIATAPNSAAAPGDYTTNNLTGQTIPAGSSTYSFTVLVNGDTTAEANETFFVNVTSVVGASVADGQGTGTINNDDVALTAIHDIQGPGNSSPIVGATVTTRGIVTGIKNNGFFIQEPDASVDADPATSEGVFVFTSSAPAGTILVGDQVQVTATVIEFVPAQDPLQPPLTELSSPTVTELSAGNPLPTAVTLSASLPDPAGPV
ncbi:MAG TPA: lamin tail domain-containing protein, partial [Thermoanaerobaculia bacterium]|nr:lamin tail domain-containing protein [Thermoanaerobaculia bacterium]